VKYKKITKCSLVSLLGILLALSLVLWIGCDKTDIPSGSETSDETMFAGAPPLDVLEFVKNIQEKHTNGLMAVPGVVGTATGLGVVGPAVVVLTEAPGIRGIPEKLDGVPVVTRATGKIHALKKPENPGGGKPGGKKEPVDPTARFDRPVPIGVSTGHPYITAGTISCRVTDGADVYALSNNHVYANENKASISDNVLQPGPFDGGINPGDAIGTLFDFEPIDFSGEDNIIDAAIALSSTALLGNATPSNGYGTPKSTTAEAVLNMNVMK
jgi:hypothetical protein